MKFFNYLDPKLIFTSIDGKNKEEVFGNLIDKIADVDKTFQSKSKTIFSEIMKREKKLTTSIGNGVSIPHARIKEYDDMLLAVATPAQPIFDTTIDGSKEEIKVFFLIITSDLKNKLMLNLLSCISKISKDEQFIKILNTSTNSNEIFESIKKSDVVVNSDVLAEDIMNTEIKPLSMNESIQTAACMMVSNGISSLPVVDEEGNFVGEVSESELISFGMPKITSMMKGLGFLRDSEFFGDYFKNESTTKIADILKEKVILVDRKASVMEVAFSMISKRSFRAYVVENSRYYGLITGGDIVNKVLHI